MRNEFDILNDVKVDADKYKEIKFDSNEEFKNKMKNKIRESKSYNKKRKMAVASVGILLGSMVVVSEPSLAYIKNIGKQIEHFFNREDNSFEGYKVVLNQVVENNGIEIELKEIMLGDGELLLSLKVDDSKLDKSYFGIDKEQDSYPELYEPKVQIGDMLFAQTGGGSTTEPGDDTSKNMLLTCDLNALDTNNDGDADVKGFDLISNLDVTKDYDLKVEIDKVGYMIEVNDKNISDLTNAPTYMEMTEVNGGGVNADTGESFETRSGIVHGNWTFETSINAKNLVDNIKIYEVNDSFSIKYEDLEIDVFVEEVRISPTKIKIKRSFKVNGDVRIGEDEPPKFLSFIAKDETGKEVELRGNIDLLANEELVKECMFVEGEIVRDMKNIKIIPAIEDWSKEINRIKTFEKETINLELK